jgi:AcrR family transcriptional regulator
MTEDKTNIKERILAVSARLFAEKGFDGISIDELAQGAKVNKSMIYYYFSSKEGLLINLIQRYIQEFESSFMKVKTKKTRSIKAAIEELVTLVVEYMSQNRNIIAILFHETLMKMPKSKVDIVTFINPLWDKIERDIRARYPGMIEASLVDKLMAISLIISFVIIQDRLDGLDKSAVAEAKHLFIQRVTSIIAALLTETARK